MPDLTAKFLPELYSRRIPGLDLGGEFVYPDYAGGSIANLTSTIARFFGAPDLGLPALRPELLGPLAEAAPARKVLLVVVDALPFLMLKRWMEAGGLDAWGLLAETGLLAPLTSVTPCTTST